MQSSSQKSLSKVLSFLLIFAFGITLSGCQAGAGRSGFCLWGLFVFGLLGLILILIWYFTFRPAWRWPWEDDEEDIMGELREHLLELDSDSLKKFILKVRKKVLGWKGGGWGAQLIRRTATESFREAAAISHDKEQAVTRFIAGLISLKALGALAVLEIGIEMAVDTFLIKTPGVLSTLRKLAELKKWSSIAEKIKELEMINDVTEQIKKADEIKKELEKIRKETSTESLTEDLSRGEVDDATETAAAGSFIDRIGILLVQPVAILQGCTPVLFLVGFLAILGTVGVVLIALLGGFQRTADAPEATHAVLETEEPDSVSQESIQPSPTFLPTQTVPEAFDFIMKHGNFSEEQKAQLALAYLVDPDGDWIYSISNQVIKEKLMQNDILAYFGIEGFFFDIGVQYWFNDSYFPCNQEIEGGWVVCQEPSQPMPEGEILILAMKLADVVPLEDPDHFYTYAAVLDADGDPSNNFQFFPPYDWDYFQNTDRWYQLNWVPQRGSWSLDVMDMRPEPGPVNSKARVVIYGDVIGFFIPAEEYSVDSPGFRLTAFGHDGTYSPDVSSGDVTGADPTEPLTIPPAEPLVIEE